MPALPLVPATILDQLTLAPQGKGINRIQAMLGATNITYSDTLEEQMVQFNFKMCKKYNGVQIRLNGGDLYDLTFYRRFRGGLKTHEVKDVFAEDLEWLFRDVTGLDTHL